MSVHQYPRYIQVQVNIFNNNDDLRPLDEQNLYVCIYIQACGGSMFISWPPVRI